MMIRPPANHQHRPPPLQPVTPCTLESCIAYYFSGGTRLCCALLPPMLSSLGIATSSPSLPFPPYTYTYSIATTSQSLSPLFLMSRNPMASFFLTWDHTIVIKQAPRPPQPSVSSYQPPVPSNHPETVGLNIDRCDTAVDDTHDTHCQPPHPPCPVYGQLFLFISEILTTGPYICYLI